MLICTQAQFEAFMGGFIEVCLQQQMFKLNLEIKRSQCYYIPHVFDILRSTRKHVQNGVYSSNEYDCVSG